MVVVPEFLIKRIYQKGTLKKLENGAYLSIKLLGNTTKPVCVQLTQKICEILKQELGTEGQNIYVSYHPVDLWGWNGSMF